MSKDKPNSMRKKSGKELIGKITSKATAKTVQVTVVQGSRHPIYGKVVRKMRHYAVHYDGPPLEIGDRVRIRETKPISKTKHFIVVEKLAS